MKFKRSIPCNKVNTEFPFVPLDYSFWSGLNWLFLYKLTVIQSTTQKNNQSCRVQSMRRSEKVIAIFKHIEAVNLPKIKVGSLFPSSLRHFHWRRGETQNQNSQRFQNYVNRLNLNREGRTFKIYEFFMIISWVFSLNLEAPSWFPNLDSVNLGESRKWRENV